MKTKLKLKLLIVIVSTVCLASCAALSNMSEQEAYEVGYQIGTTLRQLSE